MHNANDYRDLIRRVFLQISIIVLFFSCSCAGASPVSEKRYQELADRTVQLLSSSAVNWKIANDTLIQTETIDSVSVEVHKITFSNGITYEYAYAVPKQKASQAILSVVGSGPADPKGMAIGFAKKGFIAMSYSWWPPDGHGSFYDNDIENDILFNATVLGLISGQIMKRLDQSIGTVGYVVEGSSYGGIIAAWVAAVDKDVKALAMHASSVDLIALRGTSRLIPAEIPVEHIARFQPLLALRRDIPVHAILRSQDEFFPLEASYEAFSKLSGTVIRIFPNLSHGEPLPENYFLLVGNGLRSSLKYSPAENTLPVLTVDKKKWFYYRIGVTPEGSQKIRSVHYTQAKPVEMARFHELKKAEDGGYYAYLDRNLESFFIITAEDPYKSRSVSYLIKAGREKL